jgi:hypothetical protein
MCEMRNKPQKKWRSIAEHPEDAMAMLKIEQNKFKILRS